MQVSFGDDMHSRDLVSIFGIFFLRWVFFGSGAVVIFVGSVNVMR